MLATLLPSWIRSRIPGKKWIKQLLRKQAPAMMPLLKPLPYDPMIHTAALDGLFLAHKKQVAPGFCIGPEDVVVEAGCGSGRLCSFMAELGAEVIALDIDPECIRETTGRLAAWPNRNHRAIISDCNPIPLPSGVATRVVAQEVIEHVHDPVAFMSELARVGKPGALYFFSCPDPASEVWMQKLAPESYWREPNHLRILQHDDLDTLTRQAGLQPIHRFGYGAYWTIWWALFWGAGVNLGAESDSCKMLNHWLSTWAELLESPNGIRVKRALDELIPKSQALIARKPV